MKINHIFLVINTADFTGQSDWWSTLIGRRSDREPMPPCREWILAEDDLFQVLDSAEGHGGATVTLHIPNLDALIRRLSGAGIDVPGPVDVEGFENLRYSEFSDPDGNKVRIPDGN